MKPIEEKDREMLRKELEHFFKNWGFDVPGYEGNEKGETFFALVIGNALLVLMMTVISSFI